MWGHVHPKTQREECPSTWERERERALPPLFICFFLPPGLSYINWASQESVFSTWGPHSSLGTFLCSIFTSFSLPCLLATTILDSFSLFLTTQHTYIYIYVYVHICTHTHIFHTSIYTYTHIHIHTRTHMHTHCKILSTASLFLIVKENKTSQMPCYSAWCCCC